MRVDTIFKVNIMYFYSLRNLYKINKKKKIEF